MQIGKDVDHIFHLGNAIQNMPAQKHADKGEQ